MRASFDPLVSIVIPVYNGKDYLQEAIQSAIDQTYKNIEIIVINDGSNDQGETEKIILSFGDKIKYIFKTNGGVGSALNRGIAEMKGDYFSWLSHDDVYYPDKIKKQIDHIRQLDEKDVILYGNLDIIDQHSKIKRHRKSFAVSPEKFKYSLITDFIINGCTLLVPGKCFEYYLFNENLKTVQDYDLFIRLSDNYKFIFQNETFIKSREHPKQGSKTIPDHLKESEGFYKNLFTKYPVDLWLIASENKYAATMFISLAFKTLKQGQYLAANYCLNRGEPHFKELPFIQKLLYFIKFLALKIVCKILI